jgi:inorganic pyrophosphatase
MSVDWQEAKAILLEVESLFNRDDDIRDVQDVKKMAHELEANFSRNLKDAKEIIKREC